MRALFRQRPARRRSGNARWAAGLSLAVVVSLGLAACGSSSGGSGTSGGSSGSAAKKLTVGLVDFSVTTAGAEVQVVAMRAAFKAQGWKVLDQSSNGDISDANTICTQFVTEKVDAIVTEVWTTSQMAQCLASAGAANIPVFFAASSLGTGAAGAISTTGAAPINQLFIQSILKTTNPVVFAINYTPGLPCLDRMIDFDAKMKQEAPKIPITNHAGVIPGDVQDADAATQAFLNGHPASSGEHIAIWTCESGQAIGALSALRQTGRTGIPIYTWDLGKQVVQPISSGDFTATLIVPPAGMGAIAVTMIKKYLSNKKAVEYNAPTTIVTSKNVAAACKTSPALCQ